MASSDVVQYEEEFILNARGLKLFTCRWEPKNKEPKALNFVCHGYAMECSISTKGTGAQLAKAGYAVHGTDYKGHGKSAGLEGYIRSFEDLRKENKMKKRYLVGESMGGAVALLLHRKKPSLWDGAVLVAPMCKIAEEVVPHRLVINMLKKLCRFVPTCRIIPTQNVIDRAIKNPEWREAVRNNPYCFNGRPRPRTGYELLMVSLDIERNLDKEINFG